MFAVYSNLKTCVENLNKSGSIDSYIAHYILENHDFIPNMSISELSLACNTSQSSISRFCRRINNSNFKELKLELMEYNSYLKKEVHGEFTEDFMSSNDYFSDLYPSINETRELLTPNILNKVIQWLDSSKSIYFFGSSFSNNVAKDACENFTRINQLSFSFSSVKSQLNAIELITANDLIVFVTFSGTTKHIKRLYRKLKNKNCRIIWITANKERGLNKQNEMILPVSSLALHQYETSLIEGINLRIAVDLVYLYYTDYLRQQH
ncbi:RpiR family transcriptional regulator [Vagococcus lutrae]|uniref:MurR/RpiR family transcriptional regulator n=1 Tax=Vagococcus lutrae TaxID=81947 RepID=UPI00192798DF|nr:MurR/RpiR family transcriptional regulator [Vagococcus lutrae]GEQ61133.1 RpiR family transcriptional regulator [Vagococcus lutrae]GEQ63038.1 RpiR family transcriptional regulator [Vagococcus lutrae]GEQ64823.1 RpiR family transcriptional regulator [Vagococcus lutrae]